MSRWAAVWREVAPVVSIVSIVSKPADAETEGKAGGYVDCVNCVSAPEEKAEREAIQAEPALPQRGTPERDRLDRKQAETVRGLLNMAMQRPVSWADPAALPSPGCWCSCCQGRRWWCERTEPKGWRCSTCHPSNRAGRADQTARGRAAADRIGSSRMEDEE